MPNRDFVFSYFFQNLDQKVLIWKVEILELQNLKFLKQIDFEIIYSFKRVIDMLLLFPDFV